MVIQPAEAYELKFYNTTVHKRKGKKVLIGFHYGVQGQIGEVFPG